MSGEYKIELRNVLQNLLDVGCRAETEHEGTTCFFCDAPFKYKGLHFAVDHDVDCPYLKARQFLEQNKQELWEF